MIVRRVGAVAALLIGVTVLSAVPSYGGAPVIDAFVSKNKSGPFTSNSIAANVGSGKAKSFHIKLKSTWEHGPITELVQAASLNAQGYKQKWFRNDRNITAAVKAGDYEIKLKANRAKFLRLKLVADDTSPNQFCSVTYVDDVAGADYEYLYVALNGSPC